MSEHQKDKVSSVERFNQLSTTLQDTKKTLNTALEEIKVLKSSVESKEQNKDRITDLGKEITALQAQVNSLTKEWRKADPDRLHIDRKEFDGLLNRRSFVIPSFEIYGQTAGLYDYGPPACAVKTNVLNLWRQHFVLSENMLEVDCVCLTPEPVFKASGHVERFTDFMVKDEANGECYRADKLLEEFCDSQLSDPNISQTLSDELTLVKKHIDSYGEKELGQHIVKYNILSEAGNKLSDPYRYNLMFSTPIGPTGKITGYLRPETAQGIFVNFKMLYDYNGNRMPFAGATVGQAFRNEISPRSGLLRVREFTLAEVEHFCHPDDKSHPKYDSVKNVVVKLLSREAQTAGQAASEQTIQQAMANKNILNETHAYFIARTQLFLLECGVLPTGLRFRQHLSTEMAHYASDCWDAELLTSYGWIECVGIADRSCFDLEQHTKHAKVDLTAYELFSEPKLSTTIDANLDKKKMSTLYGKKTGAIIKQVNSLGQVDRQAYKSKLESQGQVNVTIDDGEVISLNKDVLTFTEKQVRTNGRNYVPSVIEPSFGIGRIIYCVLEHSYWVRKTIGGADEEKGVPRAVLSLPPTIAPYKAAVLPIQHNDKEYIKVTNQVISNLTKNTISYRVDTSGQSIGRRYCRCDDIGIPYVITVDSQSVDASDASVTLRERDSCEQLRVPIHEIADVIAQLVNHQTSWNDTKEKYPTQKQTASEQVGKGK
ncbi:glycyl tRS [Acrasis kona]|uniref:glycine--tRNA ligase n=1 Tax=Acrasis kona TaxID=1008807 RepID=A0AAW2ZJ83_9EUKA